MIWGLFWGTGWTRGPGLGFLVCSSSSEEEEEAGDERPEEEEWLSFVMVGTGCGKINNKTETVEDIFKFGLKINRLSY